MALEGTHAKVVLERREGYWWVDCTITMPGRDPFTRSKPYGNEREAQRQYHELASALDHSTTQPGSKR